MEEYLKTATEVALEAGVLMTEYFELGVQHTFKPDHSPLTEADNRIQKLVTDRLGGAYPDHSLLGEEGQQIKDSQFTWVFDPIDGTAAFLRGVPTNVFSLALVENGVPMVGIVLDPYMNRLYHAVRGEGAFMNGKKISTSKHADLAHSYVAADGYRGFTNLDFLTTGHDSGIRFLSYSSTIYAQMLVASGQINGVVFPIGNPWDSAAAKVIVEEAGGITSDVHGNDQRYDSQTKGFVTAGTLTFHAALLKLIKPSV